MAEFEPQIVAFCCNWCTYAAADLAGTSRVHYPPNVKIVRVMCSGMVNPIYVLQAFEGGADGVLVAGCHLADCHYLDGPVKCDAMVDKLRKVLHVLGLEDERFRREMVSASEGVIFARVIKEMVEQLKKVGPSPLKAKTEALA
jgi:F420-non-reducing hydrogenase iron-sulfur subunit